MNDIWFHLTPVVAMATIVSINLTVTSRRARQRTGLEASRTATALGVELQAMLEGYSENLELIHRDATLLLSAKSAGQVYRSNLGRIAGLLDEGVVASVVAAHAHHDRIEALLAACCKPNSGGMLRVERDDPYLDDLRRRYVTGCERVEAALSSLALAWPILQDSAGVLEAPRESVAMLGHD